MTICCWYCTSYCYGLSSVYINWKWSVCVCVTKREREWLRERVCESTFWSIYLLSSMAERLEWSQEEDEAEGRRRNKQLVSCCWRSMNCFIKLSLEYTTNVTHTNVMNCNGWFPTEEIHMLKDRRSNHGCIIAPKPSRCKFSCKICQWKLSLQQPGRWAAEGDFWGSEGPSCALISN